jgi:hypothetical protein
MNDDYLDLAQLDNIPEQVILEDGTEHEVQITFAEIGESDPDRKTAGQKYLRVLYQATDVPDSKPFSDVFMLPFQGLDKETFNRRGRQLRAFFECFDFEYRGWNIFEDTQDLVGLEGEVLVRVEDDDMYGEQNQVKKYL